MSYNHANKSWPSTHLISLLSQTYSNYTHKHKKEESIHLEINRTCVLWKINCPYILYTATNSDMSTKIPSLPLSQGSMPVVGYGLWKVGKENCSSLVKRVLMQGYRHLDSAANYGNEKEVETVLD